MWNLGYERRWFQHRFTTRKKPANNAKKVAFSYDQYLALVDAMPYQQAVILEFCYYSGQRIGSVMGLTWDDFNFDRQIITFTKRLKHRTEDVLVPFSDDPDFADLINRHRLWVERLEKKKDVRALSVFRDPRTGLRLRTFNYKKMAQVCAALKIPYGLLNKQGLTPHALRKTFRTELREAGVDRTVAAEAGGWQKGSRTMDIVYDTVQVEHLRAAQRKRYDDRPKLQ